VTVYFIGSDCGRIKIGYTADARPEARLGTLQTSSPRRLTVLAYCEGDEALEHRLHGELGEHWVVGEWFDPAPDVLALVRHVRERGTVNGWRAGIAEPAGHSEYHAQFGSFDGIKEFLGEAPGMVKLHRRRAALDSHYDVKRGKLEWSGLYADFRRFEEPCDRSLFQHRATTAVVRKWGWREHGTSYGEDYESPRSRGVFARTHRRRRARSSLGCRRRSKTRRISQAARRWAAAVARSCLDRAVPQLEEVQELASRTLGDDLPSWHHACNGVLPLPFTWLSEHSVLHASDFVALCALHRMAIRSRFYVLIEQREGQRS
jgi:hypothetical protein